MIKVREVLRTSLSPTDKRRRFYVDRSNMDHWHRAEARLLRGDGHTLDPSGFDHMYALVADEVPDDPDTTDVKVTATEGDPKAAAGSRKCPVQLVPPAAIIEMATALEEGAYHKGYGAYNWRKGGALKKSVYLGGALRHVLAMIDGEVIDPESKNGKTHLAGALASLGILADVIALGKLDDDIPRGLAGELIRKASK